MDTFSMPLCFNLYQKIISKSTFYNNCRPYPQLCVHEVGFPEVEIILLFESNLCYHADEKHVATLNKKS